MVIRLVPRWLLLLLVLLPCAIAWSAEERAPAAVLRLHSHDITELRATLFGYTPAERAALALQRIVEVLHEGGTGTVTRQTVTDGALLSVDGQRVLLLAPDDADRLLGQTLDDAADQATKALTSAITEEHSPLSSAQLITSLIRVLTATAVSRLSQPMLSRRCSMRAKKSLDMCTRMPVTAMITATTVSCGIA